MTSSCRLSCPSHPRTLPANSTADEAGGQAGNDRTLSAAQARRGDTRAAPAGGSLHTLRERAQSLPEHDRPPYVRKYDRIRGSQTPRRDAVRALPTSRTAPAAPHSSQRLRGTRGRRARGQAVTKSTLAASPWMSPVFATVDFTELRCRTSLGVHRLMTG